MTSKNLFFVFDLLFLCATAILYLSFADVDLSFATLVGLNGVTRKQHVHVQSGMNGTLYVIIAEGNDL